MDPNIRDVGHQNLFLPEPETTPYRPLEGISPMSVPPQSPTPSTNVANRPAESYQQLNRRMARRRPPEGISPTSISLQNPTTATNFANRLVEPHQQPIDGRPIHRHRRRQHQNERLPSSRPQLNPSPSSRPQFDPSPGRPYIFTLAQRLITTSILGVFNNASDDTFIGEKEFEALRFQSVPSILSRDVQTSVGAIKCPKAALYIRIGGRWAGIEQRGHLILKAIHIVPAEHGPVPFTLGKIQQGQLRSKNPRFDSLRRADDIGTRRRSVLNSGLGSSAHRQVPDTTTSVSTIHSLQRHQPIHYEAGASSAPPFTNQALLPTSLYVNTPQESSHLHTFSTSSGLQPDMLTNTEISNPLQQWQQDSGVVSENYYYAGQYDSGKVPQGDTTSVYPNLFVSPENSLWGNNMDASYNRSDQNHRQDPGPSRM